MSSSRMAAGQEANGKEDNGSTPRVMVTRSMIRASIGQTATRLFRDESWRPAGMLRSEVIEFTLIKLWRLAILEAVLTGVWVFSSILLICSSVAMWGISIPGRTALVTASLHTILFAIYVLAFTSKDNWTSPASFPTLNPAITFLVMLKGDRRLLSGLLLICAQCAGSILAALAAKELIPDDRIDLFLLGGCFGRRTILVGGNPVVVGFSDHRTFLAEFIFAFSFLYVIGLLSSSKQMRAMGAKMAVLLLCITIGFNAYVSATVRPGYSGAMFNPARCLGPAVAYGQPLWRRLWPPFFAPFVSALAVASIVGTVPIDHDELYATKNDVFSKIRRSIAMHWANSSPGQPEHDVENNTVYEVPSAGRLFSESPETPDVRPPPSNQSHTV